MAGFGAEAFVELFIYESLTTRGGLLLLGLRRVGPIEAVVATSKPAQPVAGTEDAKEP